MEVKVFLDLDDTLADTSGEIEKRFSYKGYSVTASIFKKNINLFKDLMIWYKIKDTPNFWEELPKREAANDIYLEAIKLVKDCKDIYVLTALPELFFKKGSLRFKEAAEKKKSWVKKHFPEINENNIFVVYAVEKKHYVKKTPGKAILFDDSIKNIKSWKKSGGVAYLVTKEGFNIF
jgi:5'(3')-deoxyribonucleotidase